MQGTGPLRPPPICEGALPPLRSPEVGAGAPTPPRAGAPQEHCKAMLGAPGVYAGRGAPAVPDAGAPPCTRVTFPSRGKSPKARQGLCPLESPGAWSPPFSRSLTHRAGLPSATKIDRFATLSWWANRSCFSFGFIKGTLCVFNPWRGRFLTPRMPRAFLPATNTARAEGQGIKGGKAPFAGGPGTRRSLAYLCLLSLREKVGRGAGRSARIRVERRGGRQPSSHWGAQRGEVPLRIKK